MPAATGTETSGQAIQVTLQATGIVEQYYPSAAHVMLTEYYRVPGQQVSVHGKNFMPGETVRVRVFGADSDVQADSGGHFISPAYTVPYSSIGTKAGVSVRGLSSGVTRQAELVVGTYYPFVEP